MGPTNFEMRRPENRIVHVRCWQPSDHQVKGVVVLIHGLGEHSGRYTHWATKFCNQGFAVYALDLAGHGRSSGKRGHIESFDRLYDDVAELVTIARKNHPNVPIHVYGHSMGGAIALAAAINRPLGQTTLITTGPAIAPGFEPPAWKISLAKFLDRWAPGLVLGNELDIQGISQDPKVVAAYKRDPLVHSKLSVRWFNDWLRCVEQIKTRGPKEITSPVLIVHGAKDKLTSPRASEDLGRTLGERATFKLWPNDLHELHNEPDQDEVFNYLQSWILSSSVAARG
jgi:alpha-beta hydrolase superfamily lysophospholipase